MGQIKSLGEGDNGIFICNLMKTIVAAACLLALGWACHYSCATCADDRYISCLTCPAGSDFTVIQDTAVVPPQYWSSLYNTGTCTETMSPVGANALGIVLFLIFGAACLLLRTKESFYLLITLQTYGMVNLIEIAWINPIGYILQALQYFMIFNTMGSGYKERDFIMLARKNYRLDNFLKTTKIGPNIAILAAFTLLSLALLIVICIITCRRRKRQDEDQERSVEEDNIFAPVPLASEGGDKSEGRPNSSKSQRISKRSRPSKRQNGSRRQGLSELDHRAEPALKGDKVMQQSGVAGVVSAQQEQSECCACWKWVSENVLIEIAKFLLCLLYFMIQETMLVLLVTLVFVTPVSKAIIALSVLYLHILIFCMSYAYYYRIEYFRDKKVLYINYAKKVVLPIMVVVPIRVQWLFFLFALVIIALEFVFDLYNGLYRKFRRLCLYKASEILVMILLLVYYIVEKTSKSEDSSKAAAIACAFFIVAFQIAMVLVEIPCAIKEKYFSGSSDNEADEGQEKLDNPIEDTIQDDYNKQYNGTLEVMDIEQSGRDEGEKGDSKEGHEPTEVIEISVSASHKMSTTQLNGKSEIMGNGSIENNLAEKTDDQKNKAPQQPQVQTKNELIINDVSSNKGAVQSEEDEDLEVVQLGYGDDKDKEEEQKVEQNNLGNGVEENSHKEGDDLGQEDEKGSHGSDDDEASRNRRKKDGEGEEEPKKEQASKKKKRRRQIIDPELRKRYGM